MTRPLRAATRRVGDPLNVLCMATHERTESYIARCGPHRFWAVRGPGLKDWNGAFAPIPENYTLLDPARGPDQVPMDVAIDVVLTQTRTAQFEMGAAYARTFGIPLVTLEHTYPSPRLPAEMRRRRGDVNVFISAHQRDEWGFDDSDSIVVEHGVDCDLFRPGEPGARRAVALSAVNLWRERDAECGFSFWREATAGLPVDVVGDNPGLSAPASGPDDLASRYRRSRVFVNTSLISPVPTTLLEAMASGCAVVTTRNPLIDEFIKNGVNGRAASTPAEMRFHVRDLLEDPGAATVLGEEARRTIERRFGLPRFLSAWADVFERAAAVAVAGVTTR